MWRGRATLPADNYDTYGAEQTQHIHYPEFLRDANRHGRLPGGDKAGSPQGTNITFGTFTRSRAAPDGAPPGALLTTPVTPENDRGLEIAA